MIKITAKRSITAICIPQEATIVTRYLHKLFLPDSALYKNGIFDMAIPPWSQEILIFNYWTELFSQSNINKLYKIIFPYLKNQSVYLNELKL